MSGSSVGGEGSSRIFAGYRPLGYVSNEIPCITRYITRRKEHLIVTVSGKSFQTYGSNKLGLLSVSKIHPEDITALSADAYLVFTAAGSEIYCWRRGSELQGVLKGHESPVHLLLPFGPKLISIDTNSLFKIWDIKSGVEELELTFNREKFDISAISHPSTYMDKLLLGSSQGSLQLWNIKTTKLIYTFKGWSSRVTCIEQAPAIDVMAIGLENGDIYLHNLKYDETVVKFHQDWGTVTAITFRTDGAPVMLSGSRAGHIALWNLEERRLAGQMRNAHGSSTGVTGLRALPGEPLLVTSSADNTVKMWIFDMPDGGGRLLRYKEGHAAPPTKIRFYGSQGESILSAGQDSSLRVFSTVTDILNRSLGHASYNRKLSKKHRVRDDPVRMPPIIDFTTETTRDKEWDNIGAVHRGVGLATTWSFGNQKMGELKLQHERFKTEKELKSSCATCLCLTACGNFVLIGYTSGHVDRFNIQSGIHRGEYKHGERPAHKNCVRGVATDSLNQKTVTGDSRGNIKFWRFKTAELLGKLVLDANLTMFRLHRESSLLAAITDDFSVTVVDIDNRCVVRRFPGHGAEVTDLTFSGDSRWLVTASLDSTCRVWDLPSGHCVDYFTFPTPVTTLDFSPSGDFLATAHVDDLGVYLWCNKSLYESLSLLPVSPASAPLSLTLPSHLHVASEETNIMEVDKTEGGEEEEEGVADFVSPEQLGRDLVTLANLPTSRWLNLLNLDVIRAKNKPKAPPKKPKAAPFFLPTVPGLEERFLVPEEGGPDGEVKSGGGDRFLSLGTETYTQFGTALGQAATQEDLAAMLTVLMEKGPAGVDVEVRSLGPEGGGSLALLLQFLDMLRVGIEARTNFEMVNAYLGLFLKVHGDTILSENDELVAALERIEACLEAAWTSLQSDLDTSLCLVNFAKSSFL